MAGIMAIRHAHASVGADYRSLSLCGVELAGWAESSCWIGGGRAVKILASVVGPWPAEARQSRVLNKSGTAQLSSCRPNSTRSPGSLVQTDTQSTKQVSNPFADQDQPKTRFGPDTFSPPSARIRPLLKAQPPATQLVRILRPLCSLAFARMNARKSARLVPQTLSRQLQSPFLKQAPPAYQAIKSNPPPATLVRLLPTRPLDDLPPTIRSQLTPYQLAKAKLDAGLALSSDEANALLPQAPQAKAPRPTRRRPPVGAVANHKSRPLPVVFGEDEIRRQFFRDHPYEAYRPKSLVEGETVVELAEPNGKEWTQLYQRSLVPTSEE